MGPSCRGDASLFLKRLEHAWPGQRYCRGSGADAGGRGHEPWPVLKELTAGAGMCVYRNSGEFPGSPAIRTPCSHSVAGGSIPGWGTRIPQAEDKGNKRDPQPLKAVYDGHCMNG